MKKSWLLGIGLLIGAVAYWQTCRQAAVDVKGAKLDTVYVIQKVARKHVQAAIDSVIAPDSLIPTSTVRRLIADERSACNAVVQTCEDRVANLKKQLGPARLSLFGEVNYRTPGSGKPLGTASIRGGVSVGLDRTTFLEGYADQPLIGDGDVTLNVRLRKTWRLF